MTYAHLGQRAYACQVASAWLVSERGRQARQRWLADQRLVSERYKRTLHKRTRQANEPALVAEAEFI